LNDKEQRDLVEIVQKQIANLLSDLEKRTGCYVERIDIHNTEITKLESAVPEYMRHVQVDLRRQPGSQWHK
jgi:hypothetical protein